MVFVKERAKVVLLKEFPELVLSKYLPHRADEFVDDVVVPYAEAYARSGTSGTPRSPVPTG
ncbi:MAG: hypothetical protein ABWY11_01975 [Umezawaea sp.]